MTKKKKSTIAVPAELIEKRIYLIRGQQFMLDSDLAELYGVETRALVQGVKRNLDLDRFPEDFMFQLTKEELELWRSQIVISKPAARMALLVLLRELLAIHKDLAHEIEALERKDAEHDAKFRVVFEAIETLSFRAPPSS